MSQAIQQLIAQSQFEQAIIQTQQRLTSIEDTQSNEARELHYLLCVAYRLGKKSELSLSSATQLTEKFPQYGRGFQELGYNQLTQPQVAASSFYRAIKLNPALIASWQQLQRFYQISGNQEAKALAEGQIAYLSSLPKALLGARDFMHEGDLMKADQICRHFLQQNKHHAEGLFLLAEIGIQLKVYGEAEFLLESCMTLFPDHKGAGLTYLKLLAKMGKFKHAVQLADTLLQLSPKDVTVRTAKASALVGVGQLDEAITLYQELLKINQDQPGIHLLLGHALKAAGNLDSAVAAYQQAYQSREDFGDAYWSLANTKTYVFSDEEITQMEHCLDQPNMDQEDRIHLLFALGKAQEDRKHYASSFKHYAAGNQLKSQSLSYQAGFFEQQVESHIEFFDQAMVDKLKSYGHAAPDPIFIVGLPRSGSTLLEQILASHSQVEGTMELHNIIGMVSRLRGQGGQYPQKLAQLDPQYLSRFGEQYIEETKAYRTSLPLFIDKMPNNFLHVGFIKLILPNAKIIDARRDPMACSFSCFKQLFGEGQEFTYDLDHLGRYYQGYLKIMDHWNNLFPEQVLLVQHENVVNNIEQEVRRILDYCNLPFEPACLEFYNTDRTIKTPSSEQVRQPIYTSGLSQWKNFEEHLSPLNRYF